jgi:hypothetical protein
LYCNRTATQLAERFVQPFHSVAAQEAVLEDEGWRIVMRDAQYKTYGG